MGEFFIPLILLVFILFIACLVLGFFLSKRVEKISELEKKLVHAGNDSASSKRSLETFKKENKADIDQMRTMRQAEIKLKKEVFDTNEALEACKQSSAEKDKQIKEMTEKVEAFEPTNKRAREAEDKILAMQKETVALRTECAQAYKRVESAESSARDKQIQFERVEATLESKDKALIVKQQESAKLARELDERRTEISELVIERDKLMSMEAALKEKLEETETSFKACERDRQKINDEFTECRLTLAETKEKLERLKQMFDEQAAAGENDVEQLRKLRDQLLETETQLGRKEVALKDLELVHADSTQETSYEAHKHLEWTLNHFDPQSITFKFNNMGARVFLVDVQTSVPELRYEFETGRELVRGKDTESRIRVAIRKAAQKDMQEMPGEFDMTIFYALNIYPIKFKIRPRQGQKIERIHEES